MARSKKFIENGTAYYMLTHNGKYTGNLNDLGYQERAKHVDLVKAGVKCFLVMCVVQDQTVLPRTIKSFNDRDIFIGGELRERDGDTWIAMAGRTPAEQLMVQ